MHTCHRADGGSEVELWRLGWQNHGAFWAAVEVAANCSDGETEAYPMKCAIDRVSLSKLRVKVRNLFIELISSAMENPKAWLTVSPSQNPNSLTFLNINFSKGRVFINNSHCFFFCHWGIFVVLKVS